MKQTTPATALSKIINTVPNIAKHCQKQYPYLQSNMLRMKLKNICESWDGSLKSHVLNADEFLSKFICYCYQIISSKFDNNNKLETLCLTH